MFFFYTVAYTPFLVMAIVYVAGLWLAKANGAGWQPHSPKIAMLGIGFFVLAALALSAYFLPLWTGDPMTWQQWQHRMWFQSWI